MKRPLLLAISHVLVALLAVAAYVLWDGGNWLWTRNDIVVSAEREQTLEAAFRQSRQRQPSSDEVAALVDRYVHDELAYREATELGIGADDVVIRSKLRELLEAHALQSESHEPPDRAVLEAWLADHEEQFLVDRATTFRQIYFDNERNAIGADAAARFTLGRIGNQDMPDDISEYGDASPVPNDFLNFSTAQIARLFGADFAAEINALPEDRWTGPIRSNIGLHVVYVGARGPGRLPEYDEVADAVYDAWMDAQREQAVERLYERLQQKYDVIREGA